MKKEVICVFIFVLLISFISSAYVCSDGNPLNEKTKEVDLGKSTAINGIELGLATTFSSDILGRIEADVFVDPVYLTLTDSEPSSQAVFYDETTKNVNLTNSTENDANISVGSKSGIIEEGVISNIDGIDLILIDSVGAYPGIASVKLLLGRGKYFLSNQNNIGQIINYGGEEFLVSIYGASTDNALIKVGVCNTPNTTIVEESQIVPTANNTQSPPINAQVNTSNTTANNSEISEEEKENNVNLLSNLIAAGVITSIFGIGYLLFKVLKKKRKPIYVDVST